MGIGISWILVAYHQELCIMCLSRKARNPTMEMLNRETLHKPFETKSNFVLVHNIQLQLHVSLGKPH